jgi:hypothetical protein
MPTAYTGHSFDFDVSPREVTHALIRKDRLSIDWLEESDRGSIKATSADGEVYTGTFGYPTPSSDSHVELRLYRGANGDRLLFGSWRYTDGSGRGQWLFRLDSQSESHKG